MVGLTLTTKAPIIFGESHPSDHQFINSTLDSIFINTPHALDSHTDFTTAEKTQHIYGVLSALTAIVFNSLVFIFIRKAKGIQVLYFLGN